MKLLEELRSDYYLQGNPHDGDGDGDGDGEAEKAVVGEGDDDEEGGFKYFKNIFPTEKKNSKDFQNIGSWNPVMHGCQFPDFPKLPDEQIWPFPRMVTAT